LVINKTIKHNFTEEKEYAFKILFKNKILYYIIIYFYQMKEIIEEKTKLIEEKNKLIEEKTKLIEEKNKLIEELTKKPETYKYSKEYSKEYGMLHQYDEGNKVKFERSFGFIYL